MGDGAGEICTVPGDEAVHLYAILWFDQQEVIGFDFALVLAGFASKVWFDFKCVFFFLLLG